VWIGYEALVMPGVKIGDGAIIAARSVVVNDIPAYTIAGGNPAKPIRQRFEPALAAELQSLAWWNWPADKITRNLAAILGADIKNLRSAL